MKDTSSTESSVDVIAYSLVMAVVVLVITLCCVFCREERDGMVREHNNRKKLRLFLIVTMPFVSLYLLITFLIFHTKQHNDSLFFYNIPFFRIYFPFLSAAGTDHS